MGGAMDVVTILLFFIYIIGLGFTVSRAFGIKEKDPYEWAFQLLGFGLSSIAILMALLPMIRVPLKWWIMLILALCYPIAYVSMNLGKISKMLRSSKLKKRIRPTITLGILLILFLFNVFMYAKGSFSYDYLENDDPWHHALAVKYITETGTVFEPIEGVDLFSYIDGRPPAYDGIMSVLYQTSKDMIWTLKTFNVLIISLGIIFFYLLAKEIFNGSSQKAIIAAALLTMFPTYLTHFIWSHSLALTLIIFGMYSLLRFRNSWRSAFVSAVPVAGIMLVSETHAIKFGMLVFLMLAADAIVKKRIDWRLVAVPLIGLLLACSIWWFPMLAKYGASDFVNQAIRGGAPQTEADKIVHPSIEGVNTIGILGSATKQHGAYTLSDMFSAVGRGNMINVPIGVGFILMTLIILGLVFVAIKNKRLLQKNSHMLLVLLLVAFAFMGSHGGTRWWSPFALFTFRFWLLFAVFGSLLAVYGIYLLLALAKPVKVIPPILIILLVLAGVWFTSGAAKYEINTIQWPPGGTWTVPQEVQLYLWLDTLPFNTKVMPFSRISRNHIVAFDKYYCNWCPAERDFKERIMELSPEETYDELKALGYEYLVLDLMSLRRMGGPTEENQRELFTIFQGYVNSTSYTVAYQNEGGLILKLR
jgi:hypothetical protein